MAVTGNWQSRIVDRQSDSMGRWSSVTLGGKQNRKVTYITAYRVSQRGQSKGTNTAEAQQRSELSKQGNRTHPHKQFVTDITTHINLLKSTGHAVVLMLDANKQVGDEQGGIACLLRNTEMLDLHAILHGIEDLDGVRRGPTRPGRDRCDRSLSQANVFRD